jgi:hypothetical protein
VQMNRKGTALAVPKGALILKTRVPSIAKRSREREKEEPPN